MYCSQSLIKVVLFALSLTLSVSSYSSTDDSETKTESSSKKEMNGLDQSSEITVSDPEGNPEDTPVKTIEKYKQQELEQRLAIKSTGYELEKIRMMIEEAGLKISLLEKQDELDVKTKDNSAEVIRKMRDDIEILKLTLEKSELESKVKRTSTVKSKSVNVTSKTSATRKTVQVPGTHRLDHIIKYNGEYFADFWFSANKKSHKNIREGVIFGDGYAYIVEGSRVRLFRNNSVIKLEGGLDVL